MSKNKYVEIATRKVISSYGGVGSLYETTKGAVKIEPFDKWEFIRFVIKKYLQESDYDSLNEYVIKDDRLLSRLRCQFKQLDWLIEVPDNVSNNNYSSDPEDKTKVIRAKYFPEWFYCNHCNSFKHITQWYKEWQKALTNINREEVTNSFQEPKCARCYLKAKNDTKNRYSKQHFNSNLCLEQVRFIMTAPNGEIKDLPWKAWNTAHKGDKNEDGGKITLDFKNPCCEKQDLEYVKSDIFEDYTGVRIRCRNCKKENSLSGLFGLKIRVSGTEDVFYKPVLRSSNSVYYPIIFNSIFIPTEEKQELTSEQKEKVALLRKFTDSVEDIASSIGVSIELVQAELEDGQESVRVDIETEEQYRLKEYSYILSNHNDGDNNFIAVKGEIDILSEFNINSIIQIKRLKMTSVQTGYTRQEPYDKDEFLRDGSTAKVKYTSNWENRTRYLPAIESYGEGVFIELNEDAVREWFDQNSPSILSRINTIRDNIATSEMNVKKFSDDYHFAKYLLIHTLSHILIKEFEFLCGYPATSIYERLYEDSDNMQGVLIYTIAGAEGSYGGLVSQGTDERFSNILKSALLRACDCASDPVCYNSEAQGVSGQNLAACYSCALLPENSCEQFNSYLDRAVLIDDEFGFFKHNI